MTRNGLSEERERENDVGERGRVMDRGREGGSQRRRWVEGEKGREGKI